MGLVQMGSEEFSPVFVFLCFFFAFLRFFFAFFPFFFAVCDYPRGQGQTTAIYCKNGEEFHSDPVCTDPMQNFPILQQEALL